MKIIKQLKRRINKLGLFFWLGLISIIGFVVSIINTISGFDILGGWSYAVTLLGVGLIFESHIKKTLATGRFTQNTIAKIVTFLTGTIITIGSLATIPFLSLQIPSWILGILIFAQLLAVIVLILELIWID